MFNVNVFQDQLSADMYSFAAKEIDYANYFQTVSVLSVFWRKACLFIVNISLSLCSADRGPGRVPQEVFGAAPERSATD